MVSEYLEFELQEETGKTKVWWVFSKRQGTRLGTIKWYGPWRQYVFYPATQTLFNRGCLVDIVFFVDTEMAARRKKSA